MTYKQNFSLLLVLLLFYISGCNKNIKHVNDTIDLKLSSFNLMIYENGKIFKDNKIILTEAESSCLQEWLIKLFQRSCLDFTTYVPVNVLWDENININFTHKKIVVNYKINEKKWRQISTETNREDLLIFDSLSSHTKPLRDN